MDGIKYVNLIEIDPVVIRGVENRKLVVPVNNTLMRHMAFLATDTQSCVLIASYISYVANSYIVHDIVYACMLTWRKTFAEFYIHSCLQPNKN